MSFVSVTADFRRALGWSRELRDRMEGEHPQAVEALKLTTDRAWSDVARDAITASNSGAMKPISAVTALMRTKQRGGMIRDEQDLQARRKSMKPLRDTGIGFKVMQTKGNEKGLRSFRKESIGQIEIGIQGYMAKHQHPHTSVFKFDPKRFDANVRKTTGGGGKGGKKRGKRNSNPFYFRTRNALRKMEGKSYSVPVRPIVVQERVDQRMQQYADMYARIAME